MVVYILIVFIKNYYSRLALLFVNGIGMGVVTSSSYMIALESSPERFTELIGASVLVLDSMTLFLSSLILMLATRNTEAI